MKSSSFDDKQIKWELKKLYTRRNNFISFVIDSLNRNTSYIRIFFLISIRVSDIQNFRFSNQWECIKDISWFPRNVLEHNGV